MDRNIDNGNVVIKDTEDVKRSGNWQERFSRNLKNIKKARNESLTEFAQEIGIAKSTIQSVLKDGNTTLNTAVCIADAFDMSLDELVKGDVSEFHGLYEVNFEEAVRTVLTEFMPLDTEKQEKFRYHFTELLKLAGK